ncbi:hypothetical protein [Thermoflexibacter ruber]|uniref:hypothetical protein n=1 Tax=Thermoflexibacter ruber TaxID=1003 RepID=UPI0015A5CFEA|nr:hypothetical protein [Thermoflexibacter ruber]
MSLHLTGLLNLSGVNVGVFYFISVVLIFQISYLPALGKSGVQSTDLENRTPRPTHQS